MKREKTYKVLIAGGGTGGHVFPAIAIANALQEALPGARFLFVGALGKLEMTKVPEAGYEIIGLPVSGFKRSLSLSNLLFPFKLLFSLLRSVGIVLRFRPDVAVGVGGFASGPVLFVAGLSGTPVLLQEQNSYPGITNKILARRARKICVAYEGMERYFDASRIVLTGNPIRKSIAESNLEGSQAKAMLGFEATRPLILVIGGSLGARTLNESVFAGLPEIYGHQAQLLWQCGKLYFDEFYGQVNQAAHPDVKLVEFIKEMEVAYAAADIIVSRAGALSVSELCLVGKPVILVPSPNVAEDHQTKNARALADRGAAVMIADAEARGKMVAEALHLLGDDGRKAQLSANISKLARPQATEEIVNEILKLTN